MSDQQLLEEAEQRRRQREVKVTPVAIKSHLEEQFQKLEKAMASPKTSTIDHERDAKIKEYLRNANVPQRHRNHVALKGDAWKIKHQDLIAKLGTGFLIALIGTRGTGKTQLGVEIIRENINLLKSALFTTAMDIFIEVKSTYRKSSDYDEGDIVKEFCRPRLLVIDEIQERAETAWEDRILTHLINRRYNDEKDTLLIGNITAEQFAQNIGSSILSRLNETGGIIVCDWESYRESAK